MSLSSEPSVGQRLLREQTLSSTHTDVANSLRNVATCYYLQDKYDLAESHYRRSLAIHEQAFRQFHRPLLAPTNRIVKKREHRIVQGRGDRKGRPGKTRNNPKYPTHPQFMGHNLFSLDESCILTGIPNGHLW